MKEKQKFFHLTRQLLKRIYIIFASAVIASFLLAATNLALKFIKDTIEEQYKSTCLSTVQGYSLGIKYFAAQVMTALHPYADAEIIRYGTIQEIEKWILKSNSRKPDFFQTLFFTDLDGQTYTGDGLKFNASGSKYYDSIVRHGQPFFLDGADLARNTGEMIVHAAAATFNYAGRMNGFVGASLKLTTIQSIVNSIRIGNNGRAFLVDADGHFLAHPDKKMLMKTYEPANTKYKIHTTQNVALIRRGYFKSLTTDGDEATIFIEPVEGTNWTVGIAVPTSQIHSPYIKLQNAKKLVIISTIAAILLFTVIASLTFNYIKKQHFLENDYDHLTNLWTRMKFEKEAAHLIKQNTGAKFMMIDVDMRGFKFLNQLYGENNANKVLVSFAKLTKARTEDGHGICGRGYADHFYGFFKINSIRTAMAHFKNTMIIVNDYTKQSEYPYFPKFGISFLDTKYKKNITVQELIGEASFAKSTIKNNLVDQYAIFNTKMEHKIKQEQYIESHMEKALENHEFFIMYQPKISLQTDKIIGAEALVRWYNPQLGLLPPAKFIPIFEQDGFILKLDFAVYEMVFQFLKQQIDSGNPVVPISVNMSRNHANPSKFVQQFLRIFNQYNIPSDLIEVEILERAFGDGKLLLQNVTEQLHKSGFTVAMDDFGSGESSLNMLSSIDIDVLKFDQNFLKTNNDLSKSAGLIKTLVNLGKQLNKTTLFEGVETLEQRDFLKSINCDHVQGYFYSKPLTEDEFISFVKKHI